MCISPTKKVGNFVFKTGFIFIISVTCLKINVSTKEKSVQLVLKYILLAKYSVNLNFH